MHPERREVDRQLIEGKPLRKIASRFDTSTASLARHKNNHLAKILTYARRFPDEPQPALAVSAAEYQKEKEVEDHEYILDVRNQLRAINAASLEVLKDARATSKHSTLLKAVDRLQRQLEFQARLLGDVQDGQTVNIAVMPEWHNIRQVMIDALRPYPEAQLAVTQALKNVST